MPKGEKLTLIHERARRIWQREKEPYREAVRRASHALFGPPPPPMPKKPNKKNSADAS